MGERSLYYSWIMNLLKIAILTSSFDVFLTIHFGFNLRISDFILVLLIFSTLLFSAGQYEMQSIDLILLSWLLLDLLFIPNTPFLMTRSIAYGFYASLYVLFIVFFRGFLRQRFTSLDIKNSLVYQLYRFYLLTFMIIAFYGIIQFLASYAGISLTYRPHSLLGLHRINGFTYEPSYYSTYLLIGFINFCYLFEKRAVINQNAFLSKKYIKTGVILTGIAMLLSFSRMAILIFLIYFFCRYMIFLKENFRKRSLISSCLLFLQTLIIIFTLFYVGKNILESEQVNQWGVGWLNVSTSISRWQSWLDTLSVFYQHPLIGVSLGGIAAHIAVMHGVALGNNSEARYFLGMNFFTEILTGTGVIGFALWICFWIKYYRYHLGLLKDKHESIEAVWLKANLWSMSCLILILQLNQNILRNYFWVHVLITLLVCDYLSWRKVQKNSMSDQGLCEENLKEMAVG